MLYKRSLVINFLLIILRFTMINKNIMKMFSNYKTVVYDISIYALAIIKLKETSTRRYPVHFSLPLDIHSTSCIPFSNIFLKLSKKDSNKNIKSFAINIILFAIKMIPFFIPVFSNTDFYVFHDIKSSNHPSDIYLILWYNHFIFVFIFTNRIIISLAVCLTNHVHFFAVTMLHRL